MTDLHMTHWHNQQATVEAMIPLIGQLYREQQIICSIFGRSIINRSVNSILQTHQHAETVQGKALDVKDTLAVIEALVTLKPSAARIDIGHMLAAFHAQYSLSSLEAFLKNQLEEVINMPQAAESGGRDVILYGFGRIGRLMARILIERSGSKHGLNLKAIVVRKGKAANDLQKRASLLRQDSIHGAFKGTVEINEDKNQIIANGVILQVIYANHPAEVDYASCGINNAIVIDNTGVWRDKKGLEQHLNNPAITQVLLTAPGKGDIKNIVYGINNETLSPEDTIVSAASCTTNAVTPVLKVIDERFGIEHGHLETVHAYTNDQNLIDNYHAGDRRGRAAALNMVITETGAAKAVAKALPQLEGKLTGNAIRVPTPNVSLAILNLSLKENSITEVVNHYLNEQSLHSTLHKQIAVSNFEDAVSSDFIGSRHTGIVDAKATKVTGNSCILYIWYDNEFGYSCQVNRILQQMAGIMHKEYPTHHVH